MKKSLLLLTCIFLMNYAFTQPQASKPQVIQPNYFDVSPPLRDMAKMAPTNAESSWKDGVVKNNNRPPRTLKDGDSSPETEGYLQNFNGTSNADTTIQNFSGIAGTGAFCPPDTDGEVGLNHYFQVVNCQYAIYNKSGVKLIGPSNNSTIFNGMPNNSNDGDAVVLYDEVADRWLFTQFSLPNYPNGPFYEMIAVSTTPDPTGTWYRYQYTYTDMPDYPKFGVWPDGYYMTTNRFSSGGLSYKGTGASAFDRTKMLVGDPTASTIFFTLGASTEPYAVLPSDCDGTFPPLGTPNYFMYQNDGPDRIGIYEFHADWTNPTASTYTSAGNLPVAAFSGISGGIPQKGTTVKLDAMSGRIMFRLPFVKFNNHWSIVACGTVNAGSNVAGVRWYELRKEGSNPWYIYQQATYSPDNNCRWMGSIAMDTAGNIAIGYSISNTDMYPSIRYTGRLATDPINTMTFAEGGIVNGAGSQTNTWSGNPSRWGDYSALTVDPSAPATFWYTTEYYTSMSQASWKTRVASFTFANVFSVEATADQDSICVGQNSQLNAAATGGSGTYTYSWTSLPAGFTSTISNPVVTPTVTTKFIISVNEGVQTIVDTVKILVATEPVAFAGNDTTIAVAVPLWPVSGTTTNASTVLWETLGDGTFINANSNYAIYTPGAGDKAAWAVDLKFTAFPIGTCTTPSVDQKHVTLSPPVGIAEAEATTFGLALTPNPSNGNFAAVITGVKGQKVTITVSALQGSTLIEQEFSSPAATFVHNLDMTKYSKGVYVVKAVSGSNNATAKMVIK